MTLFIRNTDLDLVSELDLVNDLDLGLAASGAAGGVVQHKRGHAQRSGRRRAHLEHQVQESSAGVHLPVPGGSIKYKKTVPEYIFQYQVGLSSTRKPCPSTSFSTRWVYQVQDNRARVHLPVPSGSIKYKRTVPEYIFQYQVGLSSTRKQCLSTSSSTRWVYQVQENSTRVHLLVPGGSIKYKKTVPKYIFQYQVGLSSTRKQYLTSSSSTRWVVPMNWSQIRDCDHKKHASALVFYFVSVICLYFFSSKKNYFRYRRY